MEPDKRFCGICSKETEYGSLCWLVGQPGFLFVCQECQDERGIKQPVIKPPPDYSDKIQMY